MELPALNENMPSIVLERLVYQSASAKERADRMSVFPLIKSDEYEEFINKQHVLV